MRHTYSTLREANAARQDAWIAGSGNVPDLSFRGNELAGETGEVCNVIKKLERERLGWRGSRDTVEHLAEELADTVICADLVALAAGIDLNAAVARKFNATSEKNGFPHRMAVTGPDGWVPWSSGGCPVPADVCVEVRFNDSTTDGDFAGNYRWEWLLAGTGGDIIAYRLTPAVQ
jgi:NTP pyrophosphatase (non-canonical NTP hydrolase)